MVAMMNGNRLLIIDENAIRKTHSPDSKKVDVMSLHKLINEILKPSTTATTVEGVPCDQAVLGSHLKSFESNSCSQELVEIVHKIYSQLLCNCSGERDANSTTEAVFNTLSCYSWEAKMVMALAAFAVIYGEWSVMMEQTDPLAESIKLLNQLPDKSRLSKILSLIDAILKVTNTIVKLAKFKEPLPDDISIHIQTTVSWTVGSVVVCTSHIMTLDDEYIEYDLSNLTGKVVEMNTKLAELLAKIEITIDEDKIRSTHKPDGKKVDVSPLHKLINEILKLTTTTVEGGPQDQAMLDSHLKIFKNSKELTKTIHRIYYQLRCKSSRGGKTNSTTVALFEMLSCYSWEAKLVLALAAFALIYGEWSLMTRHTNPLAESIKLLKQLPDKSKLSKIQSPLIDAILKVTNTIMEVVKVEGSPLPENISDQIPTVVSLTALCISFCTSHIIGFVRFDDKYTEFVMSMLTEKVDGLNTDLRQKLNAWRHSIEEKEKRINQACFQNSDTKDALEKFFKLGEEPLIRNKEEVTLVLREFGLESSNLILAIDFTESNKSQGEKSFNNLCLHAIGNTPNPYEQAIGIIGSTLAPFAKNNLISCYGFGDATTTDQKVFNFHNDNTLCQGFEEVLTCYKQIVPKLTLSGPTSFAPAIDAAIDIVEKSGGQHHVLVIIADGQVTAALEEQTVNSIIVASSYALSIVVVGVGDGPWDDMNKFADKITGRNFDNFQFVNFTDIMSKDVKLSEKEAQFALAALMKIPKQYKASKEHGFLGRTTGKAKKVDMLPPPSTLG